MIPCKTGKIIDGSKGVFYTRQNWSLIIRSCVIMYLFHYAKKDY